MLIDENEFFRQAVFRICRNLDFKSALQECLIYLKSFMPADMFNMNIFDRKRDVIKTIIVTTPAKTMQVDIITPLDKEASAYVNAHRFERSFIVDTQGCRSLTRAMSKIQGLKEEHSCMVMQLAVKDARPGNLALFARGKGRFTEEHLKRFSILNEPLAIALTNALRYVELEKLKNALADDIQYLHRKLLKSSGGMIIGRDSGLREVMDMVRGVAPLDSPVLLQGETGVGKEVIANAIHNMSRRKNGPFIQINCGAMPETLIDSELFGHEKGAFTGAVSQKRGCFERACGGTIFLDEIGELPLQAQIRMLRVLQEKKIIRVGGARQIDVDIRVIAATHQDLKEMVGNGLFRSDLRFRLNVFPITIPPLRNRKRDIPALVQHFIEKKSKEMQISGPVHPAEGAVRRLMSYTWPGNVRELENVVERALILCRNRPLTFEDMIPADDLDPGDSQPRIQDDRPLTLDELNTVHIKRALNSTGGRVHGPKGAAAVLGLNPSTLRHRMRKLGISNARSLASPEGGRSRQPAK